MKNRVTTLTKEELEEWWKNNKPISNSDDSFSNIQFPTIQRVFAKTIGGGGWEKSKKQQLKEDRINKLRKLEGKKPNVKLEKDVYVEGLTSVQPLPAPTGYLTYLDYKYVGDDK